MIALSLFRERRYLLMSFAGHSTEFLFRQSVPWNYYSKCECASNTADTIDMDNVSSLDMINDSNENRVKNRFPLFCRVYHILPVFCWPWYHACVSIGAANLRLFVSLTSRSDFVEWTAQKAPTHEHTELSALKNQLQFITIVHCAVGAASWQTKSSPAYGPWCLFALSCFIQVLPCQPHTDCDGNMNAICDSNALSSPPLIGIAYFLHPQEKNCQASFWVAHGASLPQCAVQEEAFPTWMIAAIV